MSQVTRQEIFAQAAKKLRQDFAELSTVPHAGLKGEQAGELVRKFLRGHLPKRFDVAGGIIMDTRDNLSKQTDVIIYDALHCPLYRASDRAAIIPSDNAAAVVEVKSRLDKERMREAFENINAVKTLDKTMLTSTPFLMTCQTMGVLFAFETPLTMKTLLDHYCEFVTQYRLGRHIDMVMVLDRGVITLAGKIQRGEWATLLWEGSGAAAGEGAHIAGSMVEVGENTLDLFLRNLLGHLIHFRALSGHPGFNWMNDGQMPQMRLHYLTSITQERDPVLRDQKLKKYAEEGTRAVCFPSTPSRIALPR
jgi:hypothetical protein